MERKINAEIRLILGDMFKHYPIVWNEVDDDEALTGSHVNMMASDMVYLCHELEQHFSIRFAPDALAEYGLLTIRNIEKLLVE